MSPERSSTPSTHYLAVAKHAWALNLKSLKRLPDQRRIMGQQPEGEVARQPDAGDQTPATGLLGLGEIGRVMARIAQAFEMPTLYWDIVRFPELKARYGILYAERDDVFRRSDVLSVHLALNDATHGIVGAREIGLMKPTALFVNTARGKLVDQAALVHVLPTQRLGGAGLDVFAAEPLPPDDPLRTLHGGLARRGVME